MTTSSNLQLVNLFFPLDSILSAIICYDPKHKQTRRLCCSVTLPSYVEQRLPGRPHRGGPSHRDLSAWRSSAQAHQDSTPPPRSSRHYPLGLNMVIMSRCTCMTGCPRRTVWRDMESLRIIPRSRCVGVDPKAKGTAGLGSNRHYDWCRIRAHTLTWSFSSSHYIELPTQIRRARYRPPISILRQRLYRLIHLTSPRFFTVYLP